MGFAGFVHRNLDELVEVLGAGRHFGEWWGTKIQRGYGRSGPDGTSFSLFNTGRWNKLSKPSCCEVVPILYHGAFTTTVVDETLSELKATGSRAEPGFMRPEGLVVFHIATRQLFKVTTDKDELPKGLAQSA